MSDTHISPLIVFIAGATGVVGRPLVQQLVAAGHEMTAQGLGSAVSA